MAFIDGEILTAKALNDEFNAVVKTVSTANTKATTATTDTGWGSITPYSGRSGSIKYRIRNKVCQLIVDGVKGMTGSGSSAGRICTLPAAARSGSAWFIGAMSIGSRIVPVQVAGDSGEVYVTGGATVAKTEGIYGTLTYIIP